MSNTFYKENKELDFDVNGFGRQKVLTEAEAAYRQILLLLFLRPGDYPSLPEMGIHISKRIRYKNIDYVTGTTMKEEITKQIRTYAPQVELVNLDIWSAKYKGEYYVILDIELAAEKTLSIAMTRKSTSLIDVRVEFN